MTHYFRWLARVLVFAGLVLSETCGATGTYPNRTVRFIVPFPAATPPDFLARIAAQKLAPSWGIPVIVEVRDGHVTNYRGDYEAYLYSVNKEIDDGERELTTRMAKPPVPATKGTKSAPRASRRSEREIRKEMTNLERTIARFDEQKRLASTKLMAATDPDEALRLHNEVSELTTKLAEAEDRWCQLQEEGGAGD